MNKRRIPFFVSIFFFVVFNIMLSFSSAKALEVKVGAVEGTEFHDDGLTDKQLAIQRWFAYLTYLNDGDDGWNGWYTHTDQLGLDSYRYSLAFMGYAVGAMGHRTPAYTEVTEKILDDAIQKLIEKKTWDYVKTYWEDEPTFPDPVAWENIMYSGHLMQLIALYESISGDMKYSTEGWDFVWDDDTVIHYNTDKLMKAIYVQVQQDERGGVPCEPNTIFVICNDHPQVAFVLHDAMHGTHYQDLAGKWRAWMEKEAPLPKVKGKSYLKISYLRDRNTWTTGFGTPGSDGWALAWMYPWNENREFVCEGWETMAASSKWSKDESGGHYLKADAMATMFGVDDPAGTSFYPLVETQCRPEDARPRNSFVFKYFENNFGKLDDTDGDGFKESYYYEPEKRTRLWTTANLAAAMVTKGDSLKQQYSRPLFMAHEGEPKVTHVDYPRVMVKKAQFKKDTWTLEFTLVKGAAKVDRPTVIECGNIGSVGAILLNGKKLEKFDLDGGTLRFQMLLSDGENEIEIITD